MTPGFSVKFLIDRVNGLYKIQLTDSSDYTGAATGYGFYKITYPDGVTVENTNSVSPDFEIGVTDTELNFRTKNSEYQTGTYSIEQKIYTNIGYFSLVKSFTLSFIEPTITAKDNSSVVIPSVSFLDETDYTVLGYTSTKTRLFSCFFPTTSDLDGTQKTTSTTELIMVDSGNYYEGIYQPTINIDSLYTGTNHEVNWISEKTFSFDIRKFIGYANLISLIDTFKASIRTGKQEQDYQMIMSLYSHLIAKINSGDTGIQELITEILVLVRGNCGCSSYEYQSGPITVDDPPSEVTSFPFIDEVIYREWSDSIIFKSTSTVFERVSGKIRWFKSKQNDNQNNPIFIDGVLNGTWWEEIFTGSAGAGDTECLIRTEFTYSGGPKVFNLPYDPEGIFQFYVDGVLQDKDLHTFAGSQVTFTGSIAVGQRVDIISTGCDYSIIDFETNDLILKETFTYVDTNTFVLNHSPNEIFLVFLNGKHLNEEDYTLVGDEITINEELSLLPEADRITVYYTLLKSAFLEYVEDILASIEIPTAPVGARWLVTPTVQWTGVGYEFSVSTCSYLLPGVEGTVFGIPATITLSPPNGTFDRFDLFAWNQFGQCVIIEGDPAESPIIEVVEDPINQIGGQAIRVYTGTTTPPDITATVVYDENVEFITSSVGATVDFDSTIQVYSNTKSINVTNVSVGDYLQFEAPGDFNPLDFQSIGQQLWLKAVMQANRNIGVRFYNAANVAVSDERNLTIQKSVVGEWQLAAVEISQFTFSSLAARKIRFRWTAGNADHAGYYADLIQLQEGITPPPAFQSIQLIGQVTGSGTTGVPITTVVDDSAIGDQSTLDPLLGTEEVLIRQPSTSSLFKTTLAGIASLANGNLGRRLVSAQVLIDSDIAGRVNATWYSGANVLRTLTEEPIVFIGAPSAGNLRWDIVELFDDGTTSVNSGVAGVTAVRPTPTTDTLIAGEFIWDENGVATPANPGNPFSDDRYATNIAPNTTGKYAKIWEGDLSIHNNYGVMIAYQEPTNTTTLGGAGTNIMTLSWTCDENKNIVGSTVIFNTTPGAEDGEFRLVEITGNKAQIFHRSSHFYGRIQFRIVFQNTEVRTEDFLNLQDYGTTPTGIAFWDSVKFVSGGGSVGAGAGLSIDGGGNIQLGRTDGSLYTGSQIVDINEFPDDSFYIGDDANGKVELGFFLNGATGGSFDFRTYTNISRYTQIYSLVTNNDVFMQFLIADDAVTEAGLKFESVSGVTALVVIDQIESKGLVYAADYSLVGTLDPRWIPDWGTVGAAIAASGGVATVTGLGVDNTDPANPIIKLRPNTYLNSNECKFDDSYTAGTKSAPRTGNITLNLTGAVRGGSTKMYHQDASVFTIENEVDLVYMFPVADISTTEINVFLFVYEIDDADLNTPYVEIYLGLVDNIVAGV